MELISSMCKKDYIKQLIYIPIRRSQDYNVNSFRSDNVVFEYFNYRFNFFRFFPIFKIFLVFFGFLLKKGWRNCDLIIAHNFWSDGMVAFLNSLIFKTPYVLVLRNTDINIFIPRLKHYHWLMKILIKRSEGLIFVNKKYMSDFETKYPHLYCMSDNINFICNGVNRFWLENSGGFLNNSRSDTLIFVGAFNENKNIKFIISAVENCLKRNPELKLILVGGDESDLKKILKNKQIPGFVTVCGRINDLVVLKELYQKSKIFIMPSYFETFGLVYIEALMQGCSVIHSKGQGIDGIFDEDFIKAVDPYDLNEISNAIEYLIANFERKSNDTKFYQNLNSSFNWDKIADQYIRVCKK
ncbi:hypothetical protein F991_00045 [Acinetobacter sp. CIP-A165]|uniref:glycosyltransferase family 4 protein n=1 Tax=Acinetobacter sp. CIP-A165 TaxID=40373 RepID=UPI0002CFB4A1|nr:glycosyltransferase [Acinetobacter sp. CIP-A165]ENU32063.1 hypothetical protein F991_00045 [Acinetobacter sp. CIP-A165]